MLNHFMAELGCDYPEITLKLDRNYLPAGEMLSGSFLFWKEIMDGTDNPIEIEFVLRAQVEDEVREQILDVLKLDEFSLSEQTGVIEAPFHYRLPKWLPVSTTAVRYYLRPMFSSRKFPGREHHVGDSLFGLQTIIIQPNLIQQQVMNILTSLGFQEKLDSRYWDGARQEFDFSGGTDTRAGTKEFTLIFNEENEQVNLMIQLPGEEMFQIQLALEDDPGLKNLSKLLAKELQTPTS